MKKKILIDGIALLSPFTGIGRYTYENSYQIKKQTQDKYDIYFNYGYHSQELYSNQDMKSGKCIKRIKDFLSKYSFLKKISRKLFKSLPLLSPNVYDLYWQPNIIPNTKIKAKKIVTTVHDFSFKVDPSWHTKEKIDYFNNEFYDEVKKSDHIITGSNFTKDEIIKYLKFPEEQITVIYHAVNHSLYRIYTAEELKNTKSKYNLPNNFLLFVGSIEPRKNLINLLKAYNNLSDKEKENYPLFLVGFKGWENKEIMKEIKKSEKHINYLGYVSDVELPHIYSLATVFIYPTLYEGFGIPPLEAMATGTAVIASNTSSIPEVCDEAVLYINPKDIKDIQKSIEKLINNKQLREDLITKGLERVEKFTWEKASKKHIDVFEKLFYS